MSALSAENFDLLITPARSGYTARVLNYPDRSEPVHTFKLPFHPQQLDALYWLSGRTRSTFILDENIDDRALAEGEKEGEFDHQTFGTQLFDAVFGGAVGNAFANRLQVAEEENRPLRLRLRIDEGIPELADLPWEYLHAAALGGFLALSTYTPLVRYLELPRPSRAVAVDAPLRVLAIVSAPADEPQLDVELEWQRLQEALAPLIESERLVLERLPAATTETLRRRLRRAQQEGAVHVLHFIGHGFFDEEQDSGGLIFEDAEGQADLVPAQELGVFLNDHHSLNLIFLNACEGARGGEASLFGGVAQTLVRVGIPAVLAMQFEITDAAAQALAGEFYRTLSDGYPVDGATSEARKAVFDAQTDAAHDAAEVLAVEWGTPVLFSRAPDLRLIEQVLVPEFAPLPFEPEAVFIPAGAFIMGRESGPAHEQPAHSVTLSAYFIGKTPVTVAQYATYLQQNPAAPEPKGNGFFLRRAAAGKEKLPVVGVNVEDVHGYCTWLHRKTGRAYRLPTEAEWEKAARGTDARLYPWGDEWRDGCANVGTGAVAPADAFPDGASPHGCLDIIGNVQEWTSTLWGDEEASSRFPFPYSAEDGRENAETARQMTSVYRVHRGGSYRSEAGEICATTRATAAERSRVRWRGFRVAMDVPVDA